MIKKTITTLSVVALAAGTVALPAAAAGISSDAPVQIAACGPCKAKSPCAAKNPCSPVCCEKSVCRQEPLQPLQGEEPLQSLRCKKENVRAFFLRFYDVTRRPPFGRAFSFVLRA